MPKKAKSGKNTKNKYKHKEERQLTFRHDGEEYAKIIKVLGNRRFECECFDGKVRLGRVRGSMKRTKVQLDDIVLVSLRDFQDDKVDIVLKYKENEICKLKNNGEIPQTDFCSNIIFSKDLI